MGVSTIAAYKKSVIRTPVSDFITVIEYSKALIRECTLSFSQIAYHFGFSSPEYFSKPFKKYTGLSPSEYAHLIFDDIPNEKLMSKKLHRR